MILYPLAGLKIPGGILPDGFLDVEGPRVIHNSHTGATILV